MEKKTKQQRMQEFEEKDEMKAEGVGLVNYGKSSFADKKKMQELYLELIGAVQRKFPGESRHQTALRYIKESERSSNYSQRDIEGQEDIDVEE